MPSISRVAPSRQDPPDAATTARRASSQTPSESISMPSRSKTTAPGSARAVERGTQGIEVRRSEDDSVARRDIDELDADALPRDLPGEVREGPGAAPGVDD